MDDGGVVCISSDDETEENNSIASTSQATAATNLAKQFSRLSYHYNEYDWSYTDRSNETASTSTLGPENVDNVDDDDVVYVPDDNEEQIYLLEPIRNISRKILFGDDLIGPTEFPYNLLLEFELHLSNSLKNLSYQTELNVWKCALHQLACIKCVYEKIINVSSNFYS